MVNAVEWLLFMSAMSVYIALTICFGLATRDETFVL